MREAGDMREKAVMEEGTTGADRVPYGNDTGRVVCDAPLAPVEKGRGGVEGPAGMANAPYHFLQWCASPYHFLRQAIPAWRTCHPECAIVARVRTVHTHGPVP